MIYRFHVFCLVVAMCCLSGCEKDELTKPAQVKFAFKMGHEKQENERFSFSGGSFQIESISLNGDRDKGEDITFTSDFGTLVNVDLASGTAVPPVVFDLPQGIYSRIGLVIATNSAITIKGICKQPLPLVQIPVYLEVELEALRIDVKPGDNATDIFINRDTGAVIEVYLNPIQWVGNISLVNLDGVEMETIDGVSSMVISKSSNPRLYEDLYIKIPETIEAIIK